MNTYCELQRYRSWCRHTRRRCPSLGRGRPWWRVWRLACCSRGRFGCSCQSSRCTCLSILSDFVCVLWVWRIGGEVLTVHGDAVSNSSISAFGLNGHLRSGYFSHCKQEGFLKSQAAMERTLTASRQKSVAVHAPLLGLNVVGNGLDQIAVGSTHADPE